MCALITKLLIIFSRKIKENLVFVKSDLESDVNQMKTFCFCANNINITNLNDKSKLINVYLSVLPFKNLFSGNMYQILHV